MHRGAYQLDVLWPGSATAELFAALADVLGEFPDIAKSWPFVFVPSTSDLGLGDVLPRAPIPASVTQRLVSKVPNAIFTSNPCRCVHGRGCRAMHKKLALLPRARSF